MLFYAHKNIPRGWMFQQDYDPKHISKVATKWFTAKKIKDLDLEFFQVNHLTQIQLKIFVTHWKKSQKKIILLRQNSFRI